MGICWITCGLLPHMLQRRACDNGGLHPSVLRQQPVARVLRLVRLSPEGGAVLEKPGPLTRKGDSQNNVYVYEHPSIGVLAEPLDLTYGLFNGLPKPLALRMQHESGEALTAQIVLKRVISKCVEHICLPHLSRSRS